MQHVQLTSTPLTYTDMSRISRAFDRTGCLRTLGQTVCGKAFTASAFEELRTGT